MNEKELLRLAWQTAKNAYAPYSRFTVGAALEAEDGRVFTGCNVENAALGSSICAERVAMTKAVSEGCRSFRRIAIWGPGKECCVPCGTCLQFMSEFSPELEVICAAADGRFETYRLSQLLPKGFRL